MSDNILNINLENSTLSKSREKLLRKIWITRKCRIEASERIKKTDTRVQILIIYFSIVLVALSIWDFQYSNSPNKIGSYLILVMSIALTMSSIFCSSRNYQERCINLKYNYIALDRLYCKVEALSDEYLSVEKLDNYYNEYCSLLESVENHNNIDYINAIWGVVEEKKTKYHYLQYIINKIYSFVLFATFALFPAIAFCIITKII